MVATSCEYCGKEVDPGGPAVVLGGSAPLWQPFLEDLRSSAFLLAHAQCFAGEVGLDRLLALITESERRGRHWRFEEHRRIAELERRLASE